MLSILGADPRTDPDICSATELQLHFFRQPDPVFCGPTIRAQGCESGFLQPWQDIGATGPSVPCPAGYFCPVDLTCKIPCPYGALCLPSVLSEDGETCKLTPSVDGLPPTLPTRVYPTSPTSFTEVTSLSSNATCPGPFGVNLCPAGYYCPLSTTSIECRKGFICPQGSFKEVRPSFLPDETAPKRGLAYTFVLVPMGIGCAVFFALLVLVGAVSKHIIRKRTERRRAAQRLAIADRVNFRQRLQKTAQSGKKRNTTLGRSTVSSARNNSFGNSEARSFGNRMSERRSRLTVLGLSVHQAPEPTAVVHPKLFVWVLLECDKQAHELLAFISAAALLCALVLSLTVDSHADTKAELMVWLGGNTFVKASSLLLVCGAPLFAISLPGTLLLRHKDKQLKESYAESSSSSSQTKSGSSMSSSSSSSARSSRSSEVASRLSRALPRWSNTAKALQVRHKSTELLGSLNHKTDTRINIEVDNLGLRLNSNQAVVLEGVDGTLNAGCVTAVMGPSGAGKTTFLNALSGRATYGTCTGRILINGEENSVNALGRLVGFVPQEDVMHRELTVREILKTYAQLRLPRYFDKATVERVVQDVIEALQLDHVSDSIIGDEAKRGISGGQRKRVNVGMEMVADPSLLFLDEPTSGLDSTTSFDLVFALKALASKGVNVIAVLHQPSFPLYQMFTNVLLLGKGGRTVFLGKSEDALPYFQLACGFKMPKFINPADFFMDVIAGKHQRVAVDEEDKKESAEGGDKKDELFKLWARHRLEYESGALIAKLKLQQRANRRDEDDEDSDEDEGGFGVGGGEEGALMLRGGGGVAEVRPIDPAAYSWLQPAGFWRALLVNSKRAATQHARAMDLNLFDIVLHAGAGAFLGIANGKIDLMNLPQCFIMYSLGVGMIVGLASLRVFGNERVVYWREAAPGSGMGLSPLPYFVAKNLVEIPRIALLTFCLAAAFYPWIDTLCGFGRIFVISLFAAWHVSGWAYMFSITFNDKSAQLMLVILCLVSLLYGGVQTLLGGMSVVEFGVSWLSPNRWLVDDAFNCHAASLSAIYLLPPTWYMRANFASLNLYFNRYEWKHTWTAEEPMAAGVQWNLIMNFWFGVLTRVLAFLCLVFSNRAQMAQPPISVSVLRSCSSFVRPEDFLSARERVRVCWEDLMAAEDRLEDFADSEQEEQAEGGGGEEGAMEARVKKRVEIQKDTNADIGYGNFGSFSHNSLLEEGTHNPLAAPLASEKEGQEEPRAKPRGVRFT